jgi:hypothetical protein
MSAAEQSPPAAPLIRWRRYAVNALIVLFLITLAIDTIPQAPLALRLRVQQLVARLGTVQGPWNLFAPGPDRMNLRVRAEITYRDGLRRDWEAPRWHKLSPLARWTTHRRHTWIDRLVTQEAAPAWEPWCRYLARELRPDFPAADDGASVRVIYREGPIRPAELRPWRSIRAEPEFEGESILTIESL